MRNVIIGIILSAVATVTIAASQSPYMGQESRDIKALSQQEIDGLLNGKGLGYAKAAELNHYPGPRHVLDLARELVLTPEQKTSTQAIFEAMKARAVLLGKQLVQKEKQLDQKFSAGAIDATLLRSMVSDIGVLRGKLRYVHLAAHLEQKILLSDQQIRLYSQLRGYGAGHGNAHKHSH